MNPLQYLPRDVALSILSYLEPSDLARCSRVSTSWRKMAGDRILWDAFAKKLFLNWDRKQDGVDHAKAFLQKIDTQLLKSNDEVIERIQSFLDRVSYRDNNSFRCCLGSGSSFDTISIITKNSPASNWNKEYCLAKHKIDRGRLSWERPEEDRPFAFYIASETYSEPGRITKKFIFKTSEEPLLQKNLKATLRVQYTDRGIYYPELESRICRMISRKLDRVHIKDRILFVTMTFFAMCAIAFVPFFLVLKLHSEKHDN